MIRDLWHRARRWWRRWITDGPRRPMSRLGCIDVDIFAEPQDGDDLVFLRRVEQLKQRQKRGRQPTRRLLDYFADRFEAREIARHVGCPFETYLKRPLLIEEIRNDLAETHFTTPR